MILRHSICGYNPCSLDGYYLGNIKFFDANGVVFETGNGWFSTLHDSNNSFGDLEFPGTAKLKRKEDFSMTEPFYIKIPREYYERRDDKPKICLYIPYVAADWTKEPDRVISYWSRSTEIYEVFRHKYGFVIEKHKQSIEKTETVEYLTAMEDLSKLMGVHFSEYDALHKRPQIIEAMKKVVALEKKHRGALEAQIPA